MAYQTPVTIKNAIDNIRKKKYVLPSIQREFVWNTDQIETLFDSLMLGYPIGTFLFWEIDKENIKNFQFYEFLKKYHEKNNRHNQKADISNEQDIFALLDGQQRMTSLYLALTGTYADRLPRKRRDNPGAYPERSLYLNLLKKSNEMEVEYDFCFLSNEEASNQDDDSYWFKCSDIISLDTMDKIQDYIENKNLDDTEIYDKKKTRFARNTLNRFYDVIHKDRTISYYLENSEELDKVLQIFIRINSGGTKLSYSDLLLSIATAQWKEKDAREIIHEFVDQINDIGDGFVFNKDLVLKGCLVLGDFSDIKFKVDNFNQENMNTIEKNWEKISSALRTAIQLVANFGYNGENLIASSAIIPIAYFIHKNKFEDKILDSEARRNDRKAIRKWLARVLLKGTFGAHHDAIYTNMRDLIKDHHNKFPLQEIIDFYKGGNKSISFTSDEINSLLDFQYGKAKTYCALTLIYPALNYNFKYHQDHIHPKSMFKRPSMKSMGLSEEEIEAFMSEINSISNLQLLEATSNQEKSGKPFKDWLTELHPKESERNEYLNNHHIKSDQSLEFKDFIDFVTKRRETIKSLLSSSLGVNNESNENE